MSIILISLLILATFSSALNMQNTALPIRKKVRKQALESISTQTIVNSIAPSGINNTTTRITSAANSSEPTPSNTIEFGVTPVTAFPVFTQAFNNIVTTMINHTKMNDSSADQPIKLSLAADEHIQYYRFGISFSHPLPPNEGVSSYTNPTLSIVVTDSTGSRMNITFRTNASGIWSDIGTNTSVENGTYSQTPSSMTIYDHQYWWSVNVTDTNMIWGNVTFTFQTTPISTSVNPITPYNRSSSPLNLTVTGNDDLSNVTLYYRYSPTNVTPPQYITSLNESDIFRNGVDSGYLNYPNQLDARDGTIYIASYLSKAFVVADATDPYNITEKTHYQDNTYLSGCHDILVTHDQKYLYTLRYTAAYLCMWNISNLSAITRVKTIALGEIGMYMVMDENEHFLYVTTTTNVRIYNITNKASFQMDVLSTFHDNVPANTKIWHPTVDGTTLYITVRNTNGNANGYGINIYNVTNKSDPVYQNTLNSTIQIVKALTYHHTNGYTYLIFAGYEYLGYRSGNLFVYNISAGNFTHPVFMYKKNTMDAHGNYTDSELAIINNNIFVSKSNDNTSSYKSGFYVYNISNMNIPPVYLTGMNGSGSPKYLNFCHEIALDDNGSARTVYLVTQNDDTLVSITPTWAPGYSDWNTCGGWMSYGTDSSYPWSYSFNFPNQTGYYEFYSIGQKTGSSLETPPSSKDAMAHYTNLTAQANFTYTPWYPTDRDTISFKDTSIAQEGIITSWSWDFGDGNYSILQNPTHQYSDEETYSVSLTITTVNGTNDTVGKAITVSNIPPTADYTYSPRHPMTSNVLSFIDLSFDLDGTNINWTWDFNDGSFSYLQNPTHMYPNAGTYLVLLRVTDDDNDTAEVQQNITVSNATLIADFTYQPDPPTNTSIISFTDASFDSNGTITSWWWDFGDGYSSTMQNPVHSFYEEHIFNVSLTIGDTNNLTVAVTQSLTIHPQNETITTFNIGWNLVSLPGPLSYNATELAVQYNGSSYNWSEATTGENPTGAPILLGSIFGWNRTNQIYVEYSILAPDDGYWMFAFYNCTLFIP
jgi:PKD repeat protein